MRIYLPATLAVLDRVRESGEVGPAPLTAFAVTPALREWYLDDDEEALEYAAFARAARAALRLLEADPLTPRRRVVLSADVPDQETEPRPDLDEAVVRVTGPVPVARLAAIHVDGVEAEPAVSAAAAVILAADLDDEEAQFTVDSADDYELEWYGVQEISDLLTSHRTD